MALGINTNLASLSAQRALNSTQSDTNQAMQRLSPGLRINSAKDDAAGMAVTSRFTAQINGMNQASRNASDAVSMLQTAEGGLQSITDNLQRIRELAVQASSDSITATDRGYLNTEAQQLILEINRVASSTQYNGTSLLSGTYASSGLTIQVGANNTGNDSMDVKIGDFKTSTIGAQAAVVTGTSTLNGATLDGANALSFTVQTGSGSAQTVSVAANTTGNAGGSSYAGDIKTKVEAADANIAVTVGASSFDLGAYTAATGAASTEKMTVTVNGTAHDIFFSAAGTSGGAAQQHTAAQFTALLQTSLQSSDAGFSVTNNAGSLTIGHSDGRNLDVAVSDGATAAGGSTDATVGTATGKAYGSITMTATNNVITVGGTDQAKVTAATASTGHTVTSAAAGTVLSSVKVDDKAEANKAIVAVDTALDQVAKGRAELGAFQSRFESVISNLNIGSENAQAGRSRVLDTDFAVESANLAKNQVLQQAGMSVLAQANALPQQVLALLQ